MVYYVTLCHEQLFWIDLYSKGKPYNLENSPFLHSQSAHTDVHTHTDTQIHRRTDSQTHRHTYTHIHTRTHIFTHRQIYLFCWRYVRFKIYYFKELFLWIFISYLTFNKNVLKFSKFIYIVIDILIFSEFFIPFFVFLNGL